MADWRKRLTKAQREHLRDMGIRSEAQFRQSRAEQERRIEAYHGGLHPESAVGCWECRSIAQALAGAEQPAPEVAEVESELSTALILSAGPSMGWGPWSCQPPECGKNQS